MTLKRCGSSWLLRERGELTTRSLFDIPYPPLPNHFVLDRENTDEARSMFASLFLEDGWVGGGFSGCADFFVCIAVLLNPRPFLGRDRSLEDSRHYSPGSSLENRYQTLGHDHCCTVAHPPRLSSNE